MNLAPEPKYLENFHKSWFTKRGLDPAGLTPGYGFAGLDADLIIPASSISSASGHRFAGLDADLIIPASSISSAFGL